MTQNHLQYFWKMLRVMAALAISGAIVALSGGYALAQTTIQSPCLPGQPCPTMTPKWIREGPHPPATPPLQLEPINNLHPQATQKLRQGNSATLNRLQQLIPN